jgi:two-component system, NarL family, response regulator DevR
VPIESVSVFLMASNRLLRETLARLLVRRGGFKVSGVSPCVPDALSVVGASGADVLILDSVCARSSACALISQTNHQIPGIKVVLIDMEDDAEIFLDCIRAGAAGYLLKDASSAEVISGVCAVAQGQAICPPQLCAHLFGAFARQPSALPSARVNLDFGLTRRQQQIVPLIGQGLTNKEIASALHLSEQTVKNHIHGIMRCVGVKNRLEVIDATRRPRDRRPGPFDTSGSRRNFAMPSMRHILETS